VRNQTAAAARTAQARKALIDRERLVRCVLFGIALALASLLCLASLEWSTRDENPRDFGSFWEAGRAASRGDNPFGVYPQTFRVGGPEGPAAPNLNPPVWNYPFEALSSLPITRAIRLWRSLSLAMYAAAAAALLLTFPERRTVAFVAFVANLAGFWHTIELGQVYAPLLCLAVGAWLAIRRRNDVAAAIAIGLLAAPKPNLAVWPVLLVIGGHRRLALGAIAVCIAAGAVPLVAEGSLVYREWLQATPSLSDAAGGMARIGGNFSLIAIAGRFGVAPLGLAASAMLSGAVVFVCWRRRLDLELMSALGLTTALLLGPVSWVGYSILFLPVLAWMRWTRVTTVAVALLCLPFWLVVELSARGDAAVQVAQSGYGVAALLLVSGLLVDAMRERGASVRRKS
jgi:hypothetical protein